MNTINISITHNHFGERLLYRILSVLVLQLKVLLRQPLTLAEVHISITVALAQRSTAIRLVLRQKMAEIQIHNEVLAATHCSHLLRQGHNY